MNSDQVRNLRNSSDTVASALHGSLNYLRVLQGFHDEAQRSPAALEEHRDVLSQLWGATFDALFSVVGTVVDRTKGTHSLPNLIRACGRYCASSPDDSQLRKFCARIEPRLDPKLEPLRKLEAWRMKAVAHRTAEGYLPAFYEDNQMHLDEIEVSLNYICEVFNEFALQALQTIHVFEEDPNHLRERAAALMSKLAPRQREG